MTLSRSLCGSVFDNNQLFGSETEKMSLVIHIKKCFAGPEFKLISRLFIHLKQRGPDFFLNDSLGNEE